jgi:outer membrane protein assembly factor BamB/tRNA A-37 threonylcarbamoyl transferase component Bud32
VEFELRDKIDNQYRVTEKHLGGMSIVYIVLDEFSQRRFAVKALKEALLEDRAAVSRFSAEARTWMNLGRQENIVEAIIYREIEGQPFLFLEYVEGTNLQSLIETERQLFPPQVVAFMQQACAGMRYVHQARVGPGQEGVVHRDLKPANLMLTRAAQIKITDFGLAKAHGMPGEHNDVGIGLGTYLYMPPEQLLDASSADRTSDVYSFGATFYVALTGRPPIQGPNVGQLVRNIMGQEPARPSQLAPGIPPDLEELIMRCVAKQRHDRFQSFEEVERALQGVEELVAAAHSGRDDVWRCRGCGYLTARGQRTCPICANTLERSGFPPRVAAAATEPEALASGTTETLSPEEEAVQVLLQTAHSWSQQGDLQRAVNVLRQALALAPGHVEARKAFDEAVVELARRKPRAPGRSYNWPMFRGNITRTGFTPEVLVPPLQRRWQSSVGEWILASPVAANGIVYAAGHRSRPGQQGHLVALEAERGEVLWERDTPHDLLLTPAIMGGNMLVVACHDWLAALDPRTGRSLWDFVTGTPITCSPAAWQNGVYFGTEDGTLFALHAQSGQRMWTFRAETGIYSSPLIWEGRILFGAGDHRLYAVEQANGRLGWEFMPAGEINATPLFHRGRVYVGSSDQRLYCLDYDSGRQVWEFATAGPINGSPAAWQDLVYIGSRDRSLYAVTADTGTRRWHFTAGDWVDSSPAISGRSVYFGSHDGKLYAVEAEMGVLMWEYPIGQEIATSPAISGSKLFVGANDGNLYCFRAT